MTTDLKNTRVTHHSAALGRPVGVWLVWSGPEEEARPWEALLDQTPLHLAGRVASDAVALLALNPGPGDVLFLPAPVNRGKEWVQALRELGKGLVIVRAPIRRDDLSWAEGLPSVLVPVAPTPEHLTLAVYSAAAAAWREEQLRRECEQLHQKLEDRVVLERAKEVLTRRLGLNGEEAYHRLRDTARRERRPLRDLARSMVDSEALLGSTGSELHAEEDHRA